ncbi:MAG: TldD/PmbA family protein [Candidatus Aminicenantes bacterium]|nr:TldD/PmbA family protein [Candidatus Aminicenantes bacterium]
MSSEKKRDDITNLVEGLIRYAIAQGANEAEISISEIDEFSVEVRLGEIDNLIEAVSRYVSMRVIKDKKTAYANSSDFSKDTLKGLMKNCVKRAHLANPDEFNGLPFEQKRPLVETKTLDIYDPNIAGMPLDKKINLAMETEKTALKDDRITNSHGASFETRVVENTLVNSLGFSGTYNETVCSLGLGLQAGGTDSKAEGYWSCSRRHLEQMESTEEVAGKAVARTVRLIQPRKIKTNNVPVIFEPLMTSWLLEFLFTCVSGESVYQGTTFLRDQLGLKIGNRSINVIDDGLLPGKLGSCPFDSEGVPTGRTIVIENGALKNFLCNSYSARRLGLSLTGNADGTGVGPNNFYLASGEKSPEEIISETDRGLILIRTMGHGLNPITGDISRGAFGLWIEKGEIVYPVSEITVNGNLGNILNNLEIIGNDLEFNHQISGPTIKIAELTVAGQ